MVRLPWCFLERVIWGETYDEAVFFMEILVCVVEVSMLYVAGKRRGRI